MTSEMDDLLRHYRAELVAIRREAGSFARVHRSAATRLDLSDDGVSKDPHVERLIESFAYLTARIQLKLHDELPEFTDSLLEVLYPHYLAPVPSSTVAQLRLAQVDQAAGAFLPRGTEIETHSGPTTCRFRTVYSTSIWPVTVVKATLGGIPYNAPIRPGKARSVLRIDLRTLSPAVSFSQLHFTIPGADPAAPPAEPRRFRFFLQGDPLVTNQLFHLLNENVVEAMLVGENTNQTFTLPYPEIRPVGLEESEAALPRTARSFDGYRLLTELFTMPAKFHFFELPGIDAAALQSFNGQSLSIHLYLDCEVPAIAGAIVPETFRLSATPLINLFSMPAEPIKLSHERSEYRVLPDERYPKAYEVYSIDSVTATAPDGASHPFVPFYQAHHDAQPGEDRRFYATHRRQGIPAAGTLDPGTDVFLEPVDLELTPTAPPDWTLALEVTATNREVPFHLPFGGSEPRMSLAQSSAIRVDCLTRPTQAHRFTAGNAGRWRLVSHVAMNHLSIGGPGDGAAAFREALALYDVEAGGQTSAHAEKVGGIKSVTYRRAVARLGRGRGAGIARGIEVRIVIDEVRFVDHSAYLWFSVIDRVLPQLASLNSFTQLTLIGSTSGKEIKRWPARTGQRQLL